MSRYTPPNMKRRSLLKSIAAVAGFNLLARHFSVTETICPLQEFEEWMRQATKLVWERYYKHVYELTINGETTINNVTVTSL